MSVENVYLILLSNCRLIWARASHWVIQCNRCSLELPKRASGKGAISDFALLTGPARCRAMDIGCA